MRHIELLQILLGIITLTLVAGFNDVIELNLQKIGIILIFSFIIIFTNILGKKMAASSLDADVEHEIWRWERYGLKPGQHLQKSVPAGVIFPIFLTAISLGVIKLMTIFTYETKALKRRAAKRFGPFSFTEMTDYHNALVGAAGIIVTLAVSFISYFIPGAGQLAEIAAFYAFFNMIPFSKLDGSQIYFGSRVLWATLAIISLIFVSYALILV